MNASDYTKGFADFLSKRFLIFDKKFSVWPTTHIMPVSGEGSDVVYEGRFLWGNEPRELDFAYCFYSVRKMTDTRIHSRFFSETALDFSCASESGLLQPVSLESPAEKDTWHHFEYRIKKDPRHISPDTLYGEVYSTLFKPFFMQIQAKP